MGNKTWWRVPCLALACLLVCGAALCAAPAGSPVAKHGQLKIAAGHLCDAQGTPVQLKGMSTMGLQWFGGVVNDAAFAALAQDWGVDVIRLAMYVGENGYATNPNLKQLVINGVNLAIAQGIYVIIDWHVLTPGNPNDPVYAGADAFFKEMSATFGDAPNVIYEIMNEPNGPVSWSRDLKPYAQRIVSEIRAHDPDNIILIGSGTWSQDVDIAAADPVPGNNLAYTFHFYSGTHGQALRNKVQTALSMGVAVFCSEWGTSAASGDGGPFIDASEVWLQFLDANKISWVNWSLSNKNETSAALKKQAPLVPTATNAAGLTYWPQDQLSASGAYVRAKIRGEAIQTSGT